MEGFLLALVLVLFLTIGHLGRRLDAQQERIAHLEALVTRMTELNQMLTRGMIQQQIYTEKTFFKKGETN